jgi:uncharacterized protein DUF6932
MIPSFEDELVSYGLHVLPAGIYEATFEEIVARFTWNRYRRGLIAGLKDGLELLKAAKCPRAFVDGSFVTSKDHPGDFDVAWDPVGVDPDALDQAFFNRATGIASPAEMKRRFGGEFYPSTAEARPGRTFLEFFQDVKFVPGKRKGIVVIALGEGT